ncbi:acetoacetate--CoA ligase [Noviherbaspirillum pedocola]|uniref:Acetoacetate--CoA ligase n=1 Tax=Noviherbaspirillum pedocola TaxID=2801341 RepID=A0A934SQ86_9BURK|nr:acetoacetate--CoA ligase [Noviherbaspirillum pedocola]MBK4733116.1 acetoacetate--CoA ligase [Noviherbaspirillum pedocola]
MHAEPTPKPLWIPSDTRLAQSHLSDYLQWLEREKKFRFDDYDALWQWSVAHVEAFWESIWQYFGLRSSTPYTQVLDAHRMPGARWFEGARLNFAEQAFRFHTEGADAERPAIIARSELRGRIELSWREFRRQVTALANSLRALGIGPGDRVVAYLPNIPETAVAFYACASIGAIWSSCSPDMGHASVLDRFRQIDPKLLFAVDGYRYGGRDFDRTDVVRTMRESLPTLAHTVLLPYLNTDAALDGALRWEALFTHPAAQQGEIRFEQLPFDHPLWILYSSGTTGMPKPIVHGHGGALIESVKGHALHLDLGPDDRFLWFSTTGWIMWNSQVTGLLVGATICIYDGNPGYPDLSTLWRIAGEEGLTFFGAGSAYFANCMKAGIEPAQIADLSALKSVGATGSPLSIEGYEWIYNHVKRDVMLAAISGGTDIAASFVGACPILPLYAGEMQARGLGIAVYALDDAGKPLEDAVGELVVTEPMPSMPLYFWNDAGNRRYLESYFDTYPGLWRHGDWLRITPRGGAIIYGRSDTTINRHGIRMGTAEIYRVVEDFPEVVDSLVVDLEYLGKPSWMPLFVVLRSGMTLDEDLQQRLRERIRSALSARHVPDAIFQVDAVPRTLTGKKMELPVKRLLLGMPIEQVANRDAMANPESMAYFVELARSRNAQLAAQASG